MWVSTCGTEFKFNQNLFSYSHNSHFTIALVIPPYTPFSNFPSDHHLFNPSCSVSNLFPFIQLMVPLFELHPCTTNSHWFSDLCRYSKLTTHIHSLKFKIHIWEITCASFPCFWDTPLRINTSSSIHEPKGRT